MLNLIITLFISTLIVAILDKIFSKKYFGYVITILPLASFLYFLSKSNYVFIEQQVIRESNFWFPALNVNFDFLLDGLALLFALLISGIGIVIFLYAASYLKDNKFKVRFFVYLILFMTSMLGVVLSDNMITLFIFWELTSVSSYLLIGFKHDKEVSRYNALQALLVTGLGGVALLAGFVMIATITGDFSVNNSQNFSELIKSNFLYVPILITIFLGAFTKSAQFPFHFWLPNAMEAPSPVSAYLHSATMVKAGIYLLARFNYTLGNTDIWQNTLIVIGLMTMFIGATIAIKQFDLKRILAYSTVAVLGTLTMLIGIGTNLAFITFSALLLAHSLYKATLFLVAGSIDKSTGLRDITKLSGLKKYLPFTTYTALFAALSNIGIIPFVGFIAKELLYETVEISNLILIFTVISNIFLTVVALLVGFLPFWSKANLEENYKEVPFQMWIGPAVLSVVSLLLGLLGSYFLTPLINSVYTAINTKSIEYSVSLWHGINMPLILSLFTILFGYIVFSQRSFVYKLALDYSFLNYFKPSYWYKLVLEGLQLIAKYQTMFLQNGYLRYYVIIIMVSIVSLAGYTFFVFNSLENIDISLNVSVYEILFFVLILVSTLIVVSSQSRIVTIIALGVVGYSVALLFLIYGSPDLAMTQFSIETLTVILFVLVLYKLPKYVSFSSIRNRIRDILISVSAGAMVTILVLFVTAEPLTSELKYFFGENSLTLANGKNIVNVILVDFRALDTLGEITVLSIAAIGVYALLKFRKEKDKESL